MTQKRNKLDLSARGARTHFAIAVALISVIPSLSLFYLFTTSTGASPLTTTQWTIALLGVVSAMIFGYLLLTKYPATIIRLRSYLCDVITGNFPDEIVLSAKEDDITVIEDALNRVLKMLSRKLQDVETEKVLLKEELFQAQKLEAIGVLASGVAHEINNPINGIMNYAQLILDELGPDSPVAAYATEIGIETERVAKIVRHLLSFARQEKQELGPERMCDVVDATLSLVRIVLRHDQIEIKVDVPDDLPTVLCQSQHIQQVIMNMVTNARDALNIKTHGTDEQKEVKISARVMNIQGQDYLRIVVEDNGSGITEAVRQNMFDPFFTTKPRDKGTGMGLSISHGIIKDHGGELSVETELGKWTRFNIDLPLQDTGVPLAPAQGQ